MLHVCEACGVQTEDYDRFINHFLKCVSKEKQIEPVSLTAPRLPLAFPKLSKRNQIETDTNTTESSQEIPSISEDKDREQEQEDAQESSLETEMEPQSEKSAPKISDSKTPALKPLALKQ